MCTSFTFQDLANHHYLSRTMDFGFELEGNPAFCPRNYHWLSDVDDQLFTAQLAVLGAGRNLGKMIFVDGLNEHGLGGAALYLPGEVTYHQQTLPKKVNLAPHEVLYWVLSNCQNLEEVAQKFETINIVDTPVSLLGITTPLHWIFSDKSGKTMVVEPTATDLELKPNPVGVLTNSPTLDWHISNLRNFLTLSPQQSSSAKFGEFEARPFSQGSGTFGLPGGYTPPERFVRTAFLREHVEKTADRNQTLSDIFYMLHSVWIPKGAVIKEDGAADYTQYASSMDLTTLTYYFTPYGNSRINGVCLTDELMRQTQEPKIFAVSTQQDIHLLN